MHLKVIIVNLFFLFFSHTCSLWKFPGQALNLSCSCSLCHSYRNAGSSTFTPQRDSITFNLNYCTLVYHMFILNASNTFTPESCLPNHVIAC